MEQRTANLCNEVESVSTGASQKKCGCQNCGPPDNALCLHRNEGLAIGKVLWKIAGRKESSVNEPLKGFGKRMKRKQWIWAA